MRLEPLDSRYQLIGHLIGHEQDLVELATSGLINHRMQVPFSNFEEGVAVYRTAHAALHQGLASLSEADWAAAGQFIYDGQARAHRTRRSDAGRAACGRVGRNGTQVARRNRHRPPLPLLPG